MRINIMYTGVDAIKLFDAAEQFENREAMRPYLIMSEKTVNMLKKVSDTEFVAPVNKPAEFANYRILVNNDLDVGEVDIR